jgi:hypothetical protein
MSQRARRNVVGALLFLCPRIFHSIIARVCFQLTNSDGKQRRQLFAQEVQEAAQRRTEIKPAPP